MFVGIICVVVLLFIVLFVYLLRQSKKPTGLIGTLMMRLWNRVYLPLVKWTMNQVNLANTSTVLDIGVGNGASSAYLLQLKKQLSVTAIDISERAIIQAKKKQTNKAIYFEIMDVHSLTFDSESFDLVTAFQTHFHWTDFDQAINEIHRVINQNGFVVFSCEIAKINYFLPEFKQSADFQAYMLKQGFLLINQHTLNQWVQYTFKKIKND